VLSGLQIELSFDEHCVHCPASGLDDGWHAGKSGLGHDSAGGEVGW
jgi:hypothetical protein